MDELILLEKRQKELENAIRETEQRLPAHSVKPPVMMDLLAFEDEYDQVTRKIREIRNRIQVH